MEDINRMVLALLDELRAARAHGNSPSDHMVAINGPLTRLMAQYDDLHTAVHGPDPEAAKKPAPVEAAAPEAATGVGPKGDKGDTGPAGPQGDPGPAGATGAPGASRSARA